MKNQYLQKAFLILWTAKFKSTVTSLEKYEFNVLVDATGEYRTIAKEFEFTTKEYQFTQAIGIAANFQNLRSETELALQESSKTSYLFQELFNNFASNGYDLENLVYYRGETHYFVMTAKKQSLVNAGVILNSDLDKKTILQHSNINREKLADYTKGIANLFGLPSNCEYVKDYHGDNSVQIFDFSSRKGLVSAAQIVELDQKNLLIGVVGDALMEPFWPEGLGVNRGYLGALDFIWMLTKFGKTPKDELLHKRQQLYDFMERIHAAEIKITMQHNMDEYTYQPTSRYNLSTDVTLLNTEF